MDSAADALYGFLRDDAGVFAQAVRDTLATDDAVYMALEFDVTVLDVLQRQRKDGGVSERTLAITVQDAGGHGYVGPADLITERVVVRVVDRGRHANNIELTRQALVNLFRSHQLYNVTIGGIVEIVSCERSGLLYDHKMPADYELLDLVIIRGG